MIQDQTLSNQLEIAQLLGKRIKSDKSRKGRLKWVKQELKGDYRRLINKMGCFGSSQNKQIDDQIKSQNGQIQQIIKYQEQLAKKLESSTQQSDQEMQEQIQKQVEQIKSSIKEIQEQIGIQRPLSLQNQRTFDQLRETGKLFDSDIDSDFAKDEEHQDFSRSSPQKDEKNSMERQKSDIEAEKQANQKLEDAFNDQKQNGQKGKLN